jgi:hypothetical protein
MNKRYQLIRPFISDKLYETNTLNKAAKQCYKEVKMSNVKTDEFAIRDIDTAEVFRFQIHNQSVISGNIQIGGNDEDKQENEVREVGEVGEEDKLTTLEKRVEKLEQYLGLSLQQSFVPLITNEPAIPPIPNRNIYQANIDSLNAYRMIKNMDQQYDDNTNCVIL